MAILNAHSHTHKKLALAQASAQELTSSEKRNVNRNRNQTAAQAEAMLNPAVVDLMRYHIEEVLNEFGLTPVRVMDGKKLPAEAVDFVLDAKPGFWTGLFLPKTVRNDTRFRNPVVDEATADRISQLLTERLGGRVQLITDNGDNLIFVGVASDNHEQAVRQLTSSRPNPLFKSPQFQSQSQSVAARSVPVSSSPALTPDAVLPDTLQPAFSDYRSRGGGDPITSDEDEGDADFDREAEEDAAQEPTLQTRYFAGEDFTYFTDLFAHHSEASAGVEVSLANLETYLRDTSGSNPDSGVHVRSDVAGIEKRADKRAGTRSLAVITDMLTLALTHLGLTAVAVTHGPLTSATTTNDTDVTAAQPPPTAKLTPEGLLRQNHSHRQSLRGNQNSTQKKRDGSGGGGGGGGSEDGTGTERLPVTFDRVDYYVGKTVLVYWVHQYQYRPDHASHPAQAPVPLLVSNPSLAQFEKANAVRRLEGWLNCPVAVFENPYTRQVGIAVAIGRQAKSLLPIIERRMPRLSAQQTVDILLHYSYTSSSTHTQTPDDFLVCLGTPLPNPTLNPTGQHWGLDGLSLSSASRLGSVASQSPQSPAPLIINVHDKHVLIIGSTGMGKSSQAGLLLYQLLATKSAAELELWIADIDGSTAAQFESYTASSRSRCARTSEQILELLGQAVGEMERRREVGDLNATFPKIVLAIEEGLMMKEHLTAAQYKEYLRLLKLLALGARKWGIWVWLLSQVLYSDADFREIKGQFLVRLAGAFEPSAAGSMGFERAAVKQLYSQKLPGQFLAHTQEYNGLLLCPALDLKGGELKRLLAAISLSRHGSDADLGHRTATAANAEANNQKPATTTTTAKAPNTPGGADTRERAFFDVPTSRSTRRPPTLHKSSSAYAKYAKGGNGKGLSGNSQNTFRFGTRLTDTNSDTDSDTTTQPGTFSFDFETVSSAGAASLLDDSWAATSTSGGEEGDEGEELALVAEKATEPFGLNLGLDFDFDFDFDFEFDQKQEQEQEQEQEQKGEGEGEGYAPYDMPTTNFAWAQPPTTVVTDQKRDWNQKQGQGQGQIKAKLETGETDQQLADILSSNYSDLEEKILALLRYRTKEGKGLSSNRIAQLVGGNRNTVLELIRELRRQVAD